jgi:hypothetical protein
LCVSRSLAGYKLLVYTPAEVCAGALLAAWKFSNYDSAVEAHLSSLAYNCWTEPARLSSCANDLVRYYQVCFPDAVKSYDPSKLFLPIPETPMPETPTPETPTMAQKEDRERPCHSPNSVLDAT